jgi:hypothetical protein
MPGTSPAMTVGAAGGAGRLVFGGIRQDFQLALRIHPLNPFDSIREFIDR